MNDSFLNTVLLLTGLLIFGEALALLVSTGLVVKPRPSWLNRKNVTFLLDDLFFGIVLMLLAAQVFTQAWIFWIAVISTFLSHALRDAEFVANFPNKFCANSGLFLLNNVKLAGLLLVVVL